MKYDFNFTATGNGYADPMIYYNNAVRGLFVYSIVLLIFVVLAYVYIKKTDDIGLSFARALFASTIVAILFYYMGKMFGFDLFSGIILMAMVIGTVCSIATLYYYRNRN